MKKTSLNRLSLKDSYEENKEFAIPIAVLIVSVFLFFIFILPQLLAFPSKKSERDIEVSHLNEIKDSKKLLESIDSTKLAADLQIVSSALPSEKNFEIILNAISTAASQSNAQIDSYGYSEQGTALLSEGSKISGLVFDVEIPGDLSQAVDFIDELYKVYPISEAKKITYDQGISKISLVFFYSPFTSSNANDAVLPRESTPKEKEALNVLSEWSNSAFLPSDESQTSSGSGTRSSLPF